MKSDFITKTRERSTYYILVYAYMVHFDRLLPVLVLFYDDYHIFVGRYRRGLRWT